MTPSANAAALAPLRRASGFQPSTVVVVPDERELNEHTVTSAGRSAGGLIVGRHLSARDPEDRELLVNRADWILLGSSPRRRHLRDNQRLIDLVDEICGQDPNIEDVVVCPVLEYFTPKPHTEKGNGLAGSRRVEGVRQPDLDQVDRALIHALQANGRASFAELAEVSGISATSAADRFRRLQADGVVSIITLPSPARIGNLVRATACLRTRGSIRSVLEHAASLPGTLWPCACGGPFGVILDFACPNEQALNEMRAKFIAIPGVTHVDMSLHRRIYRDDLQWGFEDGPPKPVSKG